MIQSYRLSNNKIRLRKSVAIIPHTADITIDTTWSGEVHLHNSFTIENATVNITPNTKIIGHGHIIITLKSNNYDKPLIYASNNNLFQDIDIEGVYDNFGVEFYNTTFNQGNIYLKSQMIVLSGCTVNCDIDIHRPTSIEATSISNNTFNGKFNITGDQLSKITENTFNDTVSITTPSIISNNRFNNNTIIGFNCQTFLNQFNNTVILKGGYDFSFHTNICKCIDMTNALSYNGGRIVENTCTQINGGQYGMTIERNRIVGGYICLGNQQEINIISNHFMGAGKYALYINKNTCEKNVIDRCENNTVEGREIPFYDECQLTILNI